MRAFWKLNDARSLVACLVAPFVLGIGFFGPCGTLLAEDRELAEPEEITLQTSDGLNLFVVYFPGNNGRETVPVIVLHDLGESGEDYYALAVALQKQGHAVLVPDLRGHGKSTEIERSGRRATKIGPNLNDRHLRSIVLSDMAAMRGFLLEKNNDKKLNIESLTIVGSGVGALIATSFTIVDWTWEDLAQKKQGKDVKALVLISPPRARGKRLNINSFLSFLNDLARDDTAGDISLLLMVGQEDRRKFNEVSRIHKQLTRYYPEPDENESARSKKLFLFKPDTELQGEQLLNAPEFKGIRGIELFVKARVVSQDYKWRDRRSP
mgnify:CR=1 FL=1